MPKKDRIVAASSGLLTIFPIGEYEMKKSLIAMSLFVGITIPSANSAGVINNSIAASTAEVTSLSVVQVHGGMRRVDARRSLRSYLYKDITFLERGGRGNFWFSAWRLGKRYRIRIDHHTGNITKRTRLR
jgi:hypothetical protein